LLGPVAELTLYLLSYPQLIEVSPALLFTQGPGGEEVTVTAQFLPPDVRIEMLMSKTKLLPGEAPRPGSEITLRPLRITDDTHAAFKVPSGL
jgi:hypothetical protein